MSFLATGLGTGPLDLSNMILGDADGAPVSVDVLRNASVTVVPAAIPESGSTAVLLLLAAGSLAILGARAPAIRNN